MLFGFAFLHVQAAFFILSVSFRNTIQAKKKKDQLVTKLLDYSNLIYKLVLSTEVNQSVICKSHCWPGYTMCSRVLLLQECGGHISGAAPWKAQE